jgi:hypothetical protein
MTVRLSLIALLWALAASAADYALGPDSQRHDGVPRGKVGKFSFLAFGGADMQWLYATTGGRVFRRHLRRKGALRWVELKPPKPHL